LKEGVFTKEELVKLWRKCGEVLHRGTFETLWSRLRYADAVEEIRAWKEKIEALLSYVQSSWLMAAQLHWSS
jgi:hypothetical protein